MIAKYSGYCCKCAGIIKAGEDCDFDAKARKIKHYECPQKDSAKPDDAEALASELGFLPHDEASRTDWNRVSTRREVLQLLSSSIGGKDKRNGASAHREQSSLFGM